MIFRLTALVLLFVGAMLSPNVGLSQSTVIEAGSVGTGVAVQVPRFDEIPASSMSSVQKKWQQILDKTYTGRFERVETCEELLIELRQLGLPIFLDASAVDDSLTMDDVLDFQLYNVPLFDLLQQVLGDRNATLAIRQNRLSIVSLDVIDDPSYFMHVTYDVTGLSNSNPNLADDWELADAIKASIAPDYWDDTNGDGSLVLRKVGGRSYISVGQGYPKQRQVYHFLNGLARIQGTATAINRSVVQTAFSESRVIEMPGLRDGSRRGGFDGGGFGGGGIGGYGLGGGVF